MTYRYKEKSIPELVDDMAWQIATRHNPNARPMPLSSSDARFLREYELRLRSEERQLELALRPKPALLRMDRDGRLY